MKYNLIAAIALLLVLEGMLPFLAPNLWRKWVMVMAKYSDRALRITGFVLMLLGVGILFVMHMFV